ncbi:hypothetical protein [Ferruginibacter sp. SUN106]|uniref:hypothetical protein n=1 Tax=Ferruginibacter sp. SUN106 TaxID=2978348 RepID=UPI003D35DD13
MNFQTMNKQRKFILIAAAVGIIGMFLPWVKISIFGFEGGSVNGMHDKGILVFLCFIGAGAVAYLGDQTKNLDKTFWFIALACGALATVMMLWFFLDMTGGGVSFLSIGFYLSALAAIGVLLAAYLFRSPTDSIKGGFDSLKHDIEEKTKNTNPPPPPPSQP